MDFGKDWKMDRSNQKSMESCSTSGIESEICWFCKKGRHAECMKEIPVNAKSDGPHDCTFDTKMVSCKCQH